MFGPCSHLPLYVHRDFPFNLAHTGRLCSQCFCAGCRPSQFNPYDCMAAWTMCAWCLCGFTEDIYDRSKSEAWTGRVVMMLPSATGDHKTPNSMPPSTPSSP